MDYQCKRKQEQQQKSLLFIPLAQYDNSSRSINTDQKRELSVSCVYRRQDFERISTYIHSQSEGRKRFKSTFIVTKKA